TGFYFMKHDNSYMAISANPVGLKGKGNHKHNDIFSFHLAVDGENYIVDPGTCVYTSDVEDRNNFRSTSYHNTVMIDGEEINSFNGMSLFQMKEEAMPVVNTWISNQEFDFFEGVHFGYTKLPDPLLHRRRILFLKETVAWVVQDLVGPDVSSKSNHKRTDTIHDVKILFHFVPMEFDLDFQNNMLIDSHYLKRFNNLLPLTSHSNNDFLTLKASKGLFLQLIGSSHMLSGEIIEGWISPSYGIKYKAPVFVLKGNFSGSLSSTYLIAPGPETL
ncbi:MAG: heparinase II/III family protein, partial [Candidatus Cloacimonadia bacterium]